MASYLMNLMKSDVKNEPVKIVHILKCDCPQFHGGTAANPWAHAVPPNTEYKHCGQCRNDYISSHIKCFITSDLCLVCGDKLEVKNTTQLEGYKERFDEIVNTGFLDKNGYQAHADI